MKPQRDEQGCLCRETHGGQNSDVRANDLAFSLHCNLMSTLMLLQMLWYKGGGQRVTAVCWTSTGGGLALHHCHPPMQHTWTVLCSLKCIESQFIRGALQSTAAMQFGAMLAPPSWRHHPFRGTASTMCRFRAHSCQRSRVC